MFRRQSGIDLIFFPTSNLPVSMVDDHDLKGLQWLSIQERQRFERYRIPQKQLEYLATRLYVRSILANWYDVSLSSLTWSANGRPEIRIAGAVVPDPLSIAHTSGLGVIAISASGFAIGVDIEFEDAPRTADWAQTFLTAEEFTELGEASIADLPHRVLDFWLLKEAAFKCASKEATLQAHEIKICGQNRSSCFDKRIELKPLKKFLDSQILKLAEGKKLVSYEGFDALSEVVRDYSLDRLRVAVVCDNCDNIANSSIDATECSDVKSWFHSENHGLFTFEPLHTYSAFVQFTEREFYA